MTTGARSSTSASRPARTSTSGCANAARTEALSSTAYGRSSQRTAPATTRARATTYRAPAGSSRASSSHSPYVAGHDAAGCGATSTVRRPREAQACATARPAGPAPATTTSATLRTVGSGGMGEAREARRSATPSGDLAASPFRADRDRIVASPFFARLGGVTQVVSASGSGLLHNRLTHSLKVAMVARAVVERFAVDAETVAALDKLGGCDPDVVEAAALAHDLGHPPFGHLGERVLDQIARNRLNIPDGFEGNAQSYRIVTSTEIRGDATIGLNLTNAVRAAILKYPWTRHGDQRFMDPPPRGAAPLPDDPAGGSAKFGAYLTEVDDLLAARAPFSGRVADWQQTVEASVMD